METNDFKNLIEGLKKFAVTHHENKAKATILNVKTGEYTEIDILDLLQTDMSDESIEKLLNKELGKKEKDPIIARIDKIIADLEQIKKDFN